MPRAVRVQYPNKITVEVKYFEVYSTPGMYSRQNQVSEVSTHDNGVPRSEQRQLAPMCCSGVVEAFVLYVEVLFPATHASITGDHS